MATPEQRRNGFKSTAHRKAAFANDPTLARNIAAKYGAKIGGGFTKQQISRRASAAAKGETYKPS
jgi:general stress protein YciG